MTTIRIPCTLDDITSDGRGLEVVVTPDLARQIAAMAAVEERAAAKMPAQPAPDAQGEAAVAAIVSVLKRNPKSFHEDAHAILAAIRAGSIPGLWVEGSVKAEMGMAYQHGLRDGKKCAGEGVGIEECLRLKADLALANADCAEQQAAIERFLASEAELGARVVALAGALRICLGETSPDGRVTLLPRQLAECRAILAGHGGKS